ncbi:glycosyltransferase family 4 protein [Methanobacterium alcaliphilum]|uniref:glycosyltransferase family 4 protein n=1 Tax=Methanobacterium alcaliphilum TaxID=392018 RepID=UPI00200A647F|nr:glycosyltransferase family 4 protein [Methanobacterium alcaliphilum]MCK9150769.1 glycosyltransferase family 4 protein [Methanobacterium alcaliphilum]
MNVCILCPEIGNSCGSAFIGGHVNNVVELSKRMADDGHDITIVTTPHRHPGNFCDKSFAYDGIDIKTIPISADYLSARYGAEFAYKSILKIIKLNKDKNFDIIHGHSGYSMPALITGLSAKFSKIPSIHTIYCPIEPSGGSLVKILSNNTFSRFFFSNINKVIAVTKNVKKSLIKTGLESKTIQVIPIGINTDLYKFENSEILSKIRSDYNFGSETPLIIYIGSLTKQKGLLVLLDALKIAAKKNPDIKLFMILNKPLERYIKPDKLDVDMDLIYDIKKKIKNYGLENSIIPLGLLNNLNEYLATSDFYVAPFLDMVGIADYPTSMLEAMAVGKPIIATDVGGISEIVKTGINGILIKKNNVTELADAITFLVKHKNETQKMGSNAQQIIDQKFKLKITTDQILKLYEKVISDYNCN